MDIPIYKNCILETRLIENISLRLQINTNMCLLNTSPFGGGKDISNERKITEALRRKQYVINGTEPDSYIITDYLDGYESLQSLVYSEIDGGYKTRIITGKIIENTFREIVSFYKTIADSGVEMENDNSTSNLKKHMRKLLMSSGWWAYPNEAERREKIVAYICAFLGPILRRAIGSEITIVSHGDLHWGNIVCKDGEPLIIDLEDVKHGDPNVDVAFFYIRLHHHLQNDEYLTKCLEAGLNAFVLSEFYNEKVFKRVLVLFRILVKLNPKFQ